jgi:hypothetical protein
LRECGEERGVVKTAARNREQRKKTVKQHDREGWKEKNLVE